MPASLALPRLFADHVAEPQPVAAQLTANRRQ